MAAASRACQPFGPHPLAEVPKTRARAAVPSHALFVNFFVHVLAGKFSQHIHSLKVDNVYALIRSTGASASASVLCRNPPWRDWPVCSSQRIVPRSLNRSPILKVDVGEKLLLDAVLRRLALSSLFPEPEEEDEHAKEASRYSHTNAHRHRTKVCLSQNRGRRGRRRRW